MSRSVYFFSDPQSHMERKVQHFMDTSAEDWDLTASSIGEVELRPLAAAVAASDAIRRLNLTLNVIGDEGAQLLAKAVSAHPSLSRLNLGSNQIGDVGAKALGDMLKDNDTLRVLILFGNGISNIGAKALAEGLKANSQLQALSLGSTRIGDPGARAFLDVLRANTTPLLLCLRATPAIDRRDAQGGHPRAFGTQPPPPGVRGRPKRNGVLGGLRPRSFDAALTCIQPLWWQRCVASPPLCPLPRLHLRTERS